MSSFKINTNWMRYQYEQHQNWFSTMPSSYSIKFRIGKSKNYLGRFSYRRNNYTGKYGDFTISMSEYFEFDERKAIETLVHEMIHLHLTFIGYPHEGHGWNFKNMMNRINREHNLSITCVSESVKMSSNYINKRFKSIIAINKLNDKPIMFNYGDTISLKAIKDDLSKLWPSITKVMAIESSGCEFVSKLPKHKLNSRRVYFRSLTEEEICHLKDYIISKNTLF